jgi:hypothetical protein
MEITGGMRLLPKGGNTGGIAANRTTPKEGTYRANAQGVRAAVGDALAQLQREGVDLAVLGEFRVEVGFERRERSGGPQDQAIPQVLIRTQGTRSDGRDAIARRLSAAISRSNFEVGARDGLLSQTYVAEISIKEAGEGEHVPPQVANPLR